MSAEKLDLYKLHKEEYVTPKKPTLVQTKPARYLSIVGQGEPGGEVFSARLGALYGVAYTVKMASKSAGQDYRISPLEGLWWGSTDDPDFSHEPRSEWNWRLLIRAPEFVNPKDVDDGIATLIGKGKAPDVKDVSLETIEEGLCVQMLHVGSYATEEETIAAMGRFVEGQGRSFHGMHHEIYLSDPRRVPEERLRTILRMPVH